MLQMGFNKFVKGSNNWNIEKWGEGKAEFDGKGEGNNKKER